MYKVSDRYKELRYNGDNDNDLYLEYDGQVVENASQLAQSLRWERRILDNGSKVLSLDNFVSQTIELTINDFQVNDTSKEFYIKVGSMVDGAYEYVPLGYYHIKDNPSTASGKTTYKLTDRSANFDVYIDLSKFIEQNDRKITKLQAVQEYCRQCNVEFANTNFLGSDDEIGIYDNTITARIHISYLAECSGCIATIGRDGKLYFIPLVKPNKDNTHIILEKILNNNMTNSKETFKISKVVYEGALMPFQKGDDTEDTLFINTSNLYISKQEDIDKIYDQVVGLELDNISTSSIIGDPSIDPWDYIQYTHTDDDGNVVGTYTSLAQYSMEFNGVFKQTFETTIDRVAKKVNSTVNSDETKVKRLKQEIDVVNGTLKVVSEKTDGNTSSIGKLEIEQERIETSVTQKINNLQIGGTNLGVKGCISPYNKNGNTTVDNTDFDIDGSSTFSRKNAVQHEGPMIDLYVDYEEGQKYTCSFDLMCSNTSVNTLFIHNGISHKDTSVYIDGEYKGTFASYINWSTDGLYHNVKLHFMANATTNADKINSSHTILQFNKNGTLIYTAYIKNFKLETGDYATAWSPAPQDLTTVEAFAKIQQQVVDGEALISLTAGEVTEKINKLEGDIADKVSELEKAVNQSKIDIKKEYIELSNTVSNIDTSGAKTVTTKTGTFNDKGLTMDSTDSNVKATLDTNGLVVYDKNSKDSNGNDVKLLQAVVNSNGKGIVQTTNLTVTEYLVTPGSGRFETFKDPVSSINGPGFFLT